MFCEVCSNFKLQLETFEKFYELVRSLVELVERLQFVQCFNIFWATLMIPQISRKLPLINQRNYDWENPKTVKVFSMEPKTFIKIIQKTAVTLCR